MKSAKIKDTFSQEKIEEIQLHQARLISQLKTTETWDLVKNIILALKKVNGNERRAKMRTAASREVCLYYTGIEDSYDMIFDEIDKVESIADVIRANRQRMAENQDGE